MKKSILLTLSILFCISLNSQRGANAEYWVSFTYLPKKGMVEEFEIMHMPELLTYFAGISLASLHIYNLKYCQCEDENCCPPGK